MVERPKPHLAAPNVHTEVTQLVTEARRGDKAFDVEPGDLTRTVSLSEAKLESFTLPTDTVVKIHGTGVRPSYLRPWQVKAQREWGGTGFVLPSRYILTNAHVVEDATVLQVQKQDDPQKFRAFQACVAHDIDLAIVKVEDHSFWNDLPSVAFAKDLPELYTEVKVVGFPTGGSTICVTKGVLSRIDAHLYVHPRLIGIQTGSKSNPGSTMILQIDAAINPGNSGGPTFNNHGEVVGVASSGLPNQQNIGYIVPAHIAEMFLDEFESTGKWSGLSELGLGIVELENDSMRSFLKMGDSKGVLVSDVAPLGSLHGVVEEGDVITTIDDLDVTNEGKVPIIVGGQKIYVDMDALTTRKAKGEVTSFRILRDGEAKEVAAALAPIPALAPRYHAFDSKRDFIIVGGIVFTRGTVPLHKEYLSARNERQPCPFIADTTIWSYFDSWREDNEHEIVVLLTILKHNVNLGYAQEHVGVVESFNEKPIRNLTSLALLVGKAMEGEEQFLRFRMRKWSAHEGAVERPRPPDIVLKRSDVAAADTEICAMNDIPDVASPAMLEHRCPSRVAATLPNPALART